MTAPAAIGRLDGEPVDLWTTGRTFAPAPAIAAVVIEVREGGGRRLEATLALAPSQALALARQITETARGVIAAAREDA